MTRHQYLWLFIWIFIFFLLFCIWKKLQHFTPREVANTPQERILSKKTKAIHFKVIKKDDRAILSGIVASEDARNQIIDAYGKVFNTIESDALYADSSVNEKNMVKFFCNFADNFSKFDTGYLTFSNGNLEIDGIVEDEIIQQTLQDQLDTLKDINIDNKLFISSNERKIVDKNLTQVRSAIQSPKVVQQKINSLLAKKRVQFLYAKDILTTSSEQLLNKLSNLLKENPTQRIQIAGHTDSDGSRKNNLQLSQRRAESVKSYLVKQGIVAARLSTIAYGEDRPLVRNNSLKNKKINRRVEFKVIGE